MLSSSNGVDVLVTCEIFLNLSIPNDVLAIANYTFGRKDLNVNIQNENLMSNKSIHVIELHDLQQLIDESNRITALLKPY